MNKSKLWHIILMVGGTLAVLAPDLTGLAASLAGMGIGWLNWVARVLGVLALIGSRWDVIRGKLAPLLIEDRTKLGPPSSGTPVVCLLVLGSLLLAGQAQASPEFGGCVLDGKLCFGPAAAVTVGKYQGGKFSAGIMPGACYEAVAYPDRWYSFGISGCGQLEVGGSAPNSGGGSLLASFANWFRGGISRIWTEQPEGTAKGEWAALFGFGSMFGGSPKYVSQGTR